MATVEHDLRPEEIRVLGCLIEKQRTTPESYPLTLNALRLACNQATNRDPVVDYDDAIIRDAAARLTRRGWARLASGQGSRATKYRHLLSEALALDPAEISLLAVMMLRGPQTPGELKQRAERMYRLEDLSAVEGVLDRLIARELVERQERRPGQKELRFAHTLDADVGAEPQPARAVPELNQRNVPLDEPTGSPIGDSDDTVDVRDHIAELREEVSTLRDEVARLRDALAALSAEADGVREQVGAPHEQVDAPSEQVGAPSGQVRPTVEQS